MLKKITSLPSQPGCYLFKNNEQQIIYVGKAKNLQSRVKSYWQKNASIKVQKMRQEIADIAYITVASETEAFILELNLIKRYNPKYNVLMRDDKSYPYIELTNEEIPTLQVVRRLDKRNKRGLLFGPYPNVQAARETVNLLNRIYPLRKCRKMPKKPCLYYHIKQCWGYCINEIPTSKIKAMTNEITQFLQNKPNKVINKLEQLMTEASNNLNYEQADEFKKLLEYVKMTTTKQGVEISDLTTIDVFGYYYQDGFLSLQLLFLRGGKIVATNNRIFSVIGDYEDKLQQYIVNFYYNNPTPNKILVASSDYQLLSDVLGIPVKQPKQGDKYKLVALADKNAKENLINQLTDLKQKQSKLQQGWEALQTTLNLNKLERIELFDVSTLFGAYSVAGMVVYEHMQPAKNEYRKFKVKNKSDVANLREAVRRRYQRVLKDKLKQPDVVMVDGGKAQVNAVQRVLNELQFTTTVIGLKKDAKHQTSKLVLSSGTEIALTSESLYNLIANMQDEVHRFTVNYHRKIRSKGSLTSVLDEVSGIGVRRKQMLLDNYDTTEAIKQESLDNLTKILPKKVAIELQAKLRRM